MISVFFTPIIIAIKFAILMPVITLFISNILLCRIQVEREKTSGDGWFNMKAPEVTEELKNDLKALQMRSAMDPKRFYKKNDREGFPKYFQVGWGVFISRLFPSNNFSKSHCFQDEKRKKKNFVQTKIENCSVIKIPTLQLTTGVHVQRKQTMAYCSILLSKV